MSLEKEHVEWSTKTTDKGSPPWHDTGCSICDENRAMGLEPIDGQELFEAVHELTNSVHFIPTKDTEDPYIGQHVDIYVCPCGKIDPFNEFGFCYNCNRDMCDRLEYIAIIKERKELSKE